MIFAFEEDVFVKGSRYTFKSQDLRDISAVKWIPEDENSIVGAVQIFHGMAEHIDRYEDFALYLNSKGFVVVGHDHRGHGKSLENESDTGIFAEKDGWEKVVNDARKVTTQIRDQHGDIPLFIVSHSMGSFIARDYISRWGNDVSGVILSGTGNQAPLIMSVLGALTRLEILFRGMRHRSTFFDNLSFGSFNKPFEPGAPTPFEWLSRDREQVDRYVNDPLCGFICTSSFFRDLSTGLKRVCSPSIYGEVPENLPVLLYSGEEDPVGGEKGSLVKQVYDQYKAAGLSDVNMILNPGGRHESLNETNRQDVYEIFIRWLIDHLPVSGENDEDLKAGEQPST